MQRFDLQNKVFVHRIVVFYKQHLSDSFRVNLSLIISKDLNYQVLSARMSINLPDIRIYRFPDLHRPELLPDVYSLRTDHKEKSVHQLVRRSKQE